MACMLGVGERFPAFALQAVVSLDKGQEFRQINYPDGKHEWRVFFFWPHDFTFVCPTEIAEFNRSLSEFTDRGASVYGVSTDSHWVHLAWRREHPDLRDLKFPMLADYKKDLSEVLGILHPVEKVPLRATYLVDPDGIIRWVSVYDMNVGRNVQEVVRTLDALQTEELCACNREVGGAVLAA